MLTSNSSACKFLRDLIDSAPFTAIHHMTRGLQPPGMVWLTSDGSDMQAMLRQHCAILFHLRSGNCKGVRRYELPDWSHQAIIRLIWSPGPHSFYLAIVSEANGKGHELSVIETTTLQPLLAEPVRLWRQKRRPPRSESCAEPQPESEEVLMDANVQWSQDGGLLSCMQV